MGDTIYDRDLDRVAANYQPLTPLLYLDRAARVFPDHLAVIHGGLRRTYADLYARARRLASALAARGIGRGDTVAVLLANTPEMVECHYGVPMTGAVLNTLNTRLDAAAIRFCLEHGEAKILITDREFSRIAGPALAEMTARPLVIDVNDPLAPRLNDIEDVERHLPGLLRASNEWFRIYKIPDGKPENQFAFSGECKNRKYAMDIVRECAEAWEKLITGKTPKGEINL